MELSVILATYNERQNVKELVERICDVLRSVDHEVVFVDDCSPDGTAKVARQSSLDYPQVRVIERQPPAGLTLSILDGVRNARGKYVAWLDADLSHPPELLPQLLAPLRERSADIACASRYVAGGCDVRSSVATRWASILITKLAQWLIDRRVLDYTSGFILAPRELILELGLRGDYGEYCIDLLTTALRSGCRVHEVPYRNVDRKRGTSKTAPNLRSFLRRGWPYLTTIGVLAIGRRPRGC